MHVNVIMHINRRKTCTCRSTWRAGTQCTGSAYICHALVATYCRYMHKKQKRACQLHRAQRTLVRKRKKRPLIIVICPIDNVQRAVNLGSQPASITIGRMPPPSTLPALPTTSTFLLWVDTGRDSAWLLFNGGSTIPLLVSLHR